VTSFYDAWDAKKKAPIAPLAEVHTIDAARGSRYALAALGQEVALVETSPEGQRNHALNKAAFSLAQLIAAGHLQRDEVYQQLYVAAVSAGLDDSEIRATLRSGLGAGEQHPRMVPAVVAAEDLPPVTLLDEAGQPTPDSQEARAAWVTANLPELDWVELWQRDDKEDWIVEPLLPARRLVALYSAPKVGKSLLMLEIAVAVARGTEVLGTTPDRARHVLYVDFENDPQNDIRERLTDMRYTPADLTHLHYLSYPTLAALDTERGSQELLAAALHYQAEVIVIDTVSRSVDGDENENDTWLNFYRHTGKKLKQHEIALIRLDHSGKDETKGQRGGSAKVGDVDAVWRMSRVSDDVFRLDCEANRMQVTERTLVLHREVGPLRHRVDSLGRTAVWDIKTKAIIEAADAAGLTRDASNRDVQKAARAAGVKAPNEVVSNAVRLRKMSVPYPDGTEIISNRSETTTEHLGTVIQ
jgi:KaiC/GvpD/RAD55 family RecA-like ATPase